MIYTAIATGALGLLIALLGSFVSLFRITGRAESNPKTFERLQRMHGNATEHIPIILLTLLAAEAMSAPKWTLQAAVIAAIAARLLHPIGFFIRRRHPVHIIGSSVTYILESGLGLLALVLALQKL